MKQESKPFYTLIHWFEKNQRDFPWRKEKTPYLVWVSEIMLQQTRASACISYYLRWMKKFPKIEDLARASEEEVIKMWEGLGYYSRARNLHKGARYVVEKHDGTLPEDRKSLLKIPGIGSYTAGAILSFGFQKGSHALDGNVKRVLSRLVCFNKDIQKHHSELEEILKEILLRVEGDQKRSVLMEALIELGAVICQKNPFCLECPLQEICGAYRRNQVEKFPLLIKRSKTIALFRSVFCVFSGENVLLKKEDEKKVMRGLWQFPYLEFKEKKETSYAVREFAKQIKVPLTDIMPLEQVTHHFTKYKSHLFPIVCEIKEQKEVPGYEWKSLESLKKLPFCSGHRKILEKICTLQRV